MLRGIVNRLRGQVRIRAECAFPERVLNLCGAQDLAFWDLEWESPTAFTCRLSRRDWKRLRQAGKNLDCQFDLVGLEGAPYFFLRFRHRQALAIGLVGCALGLFLGSFFIWDFQVEGNETVSEQEILRALEKNGVGFGTFGFAVDSFELRNYILLEIPELSYIAVNVRGCRAYVQVREAVPAPELVDKRKPGNTVASKDALVTAIQPWDGEKQVLPGTMVKKGQLLIAGVVQNDFGGVRYLRGMGKVYGRTWYDLQCRVPLTVQKKTYTGDTVVRRAALIGKNRINLHFNSSIPGDTYDKITSWEKLHLPGGIPLPVTVVTEELRGFILTEQERTEDEALRLADTALTARLESCMEEGTVLSRSLTSETADGMLVVTLSAECEEQIGKLVEMPVG